MLALATSQHLRAPRSDVQHVPKEWRATLARLRVIALSCRVAARDDLFRACTMLSQSKHASQDAYARALFRCLREALGKAPVFYRPGETEMSYDEAWLIRLMASVRNADDDSLAFLIGSRVAPIHRRQIAFLLRGICRAELQF